MTSETSELSDEETYDELPIELDPLDDPGSDDAEASDLLVGEEIDLLGESEGGNDPIELDLGTLIGSDAFLTHELDDEREGVDVDPTLGIELPDALLPDDGSEGIDDEDVVVDESKFPNLEHDDGSEGIAAEREISLGNASDEARIAFAPLLWPLTLPSTALEACAALAVHAERVVAGSSDLLWFSGALASPLRVAVDGSALGDVALLGDTGELALCVTQSGQLFRRARFASQAEQLTRVREQLGRTSGRVRLGFGGALGSRVLLVSSDGQAIEISDAGERVERLELGGSKVVAAARESATLLLSRGRERVLKALAEPAAIELDGAALLVAQSEAPLLATAAGAVALGDPTRALVVSADGGRTFRRVPGTANTTALAGAVLDSGPCFFATVYRETNDHSDLLVIDPASGVAVCIARLDASGDHAPGDAIERGEWAKVVRLAWHAASGTLWLAGGFGVATASRPNAAAV
jgi:hypothetical protein